MIGIEIIIFIYEKVHSHLRMGGWIGEENIFLRYYKKISGHMYDCMM